MLIDGIVDVEAVLAAAASAPVFLSANNDGVPFLWFNIRKSIAECRGELADELRIERGPEDSIRYQI
jgi:hypothetical protein